MSTQESLTTLLDQRETIQRQLQAVERQIQESHRAQRAEVIAKIKGLMAEHQLTVDDLSTAWPGKRRAQADAGAASKLSGRTVAPKYRDPATGNTWTGRGLQPKWLKAAQAEGKKLEDFAI
ncbi:MAG: H-NS family nucleoid-associated regulatory protein [Pseudomonadota bacterium]